jgi:hypothetical protein
MRPGAAAVLLGAASLSGCGTDCAGPRAEVRGITASIEASVATGQKALDEKHAYEREASVFDDRFLDPTVVTALQQQYDAELDNRLRLQRERDVLTARSSECFGA